MEHVGKSGKRCLFCELMMRANLVITPLIIFKFDTFSKREASLCVSWKAATYV